jgi:hypothetical protein
VLSLVIWGHIKNLIKTRKLLKFNNNLKTESIQWQKQAKEEAAKTPHNSGEQKAIY